MAKQWQKTTTRAHLGRLDHALELGPALVGRTDHKLLDFLKLMHSKNAPDVFATRAGFAAKARRVAGVADRRGEIFFAEPLFLWENTCQRHTHVCAARRTWCIAEIGCSDVAMRYESSLDTW